MPQAKISAFFQPSHPKTLDSFQLPKEIEASNMLSEGVDDNSPVPFAFQDSKSDIKSGFKGKWCDSSSSTPERNPNLSKKRCYEQYYLDLGQSDFVLHTCSLCGLMYACGVEEDEKVHRKFHQDYSRGIQIKGWRNKRVVSGPWSNGDHILLVLDSDPSTQKRVVQKVVKIMENELGFIDGHIVHMNCKVYLFISGHRIVGCLVVEPIKTAHRVITSPSSGSSSGNISSNGNSNTEIVTTKVKLATDSKNARKATLRFGDFNFHREFAKKNWSTTSTKLNKRDGGAIICEEQAVPAKCGIRAIWVVASSRRKRIASQLMDAARKSFLTGQMLEISECAYSPPTSAGMAFASGYTNSRSFLIYGADDV